MPLKTLWPALVATTLVATTLVVACEPRRDPLAEDASAYALAMTPLLADNMTIDRTYLMVAGQVKSGGIDGELLQQRFEAEILPRSRVVLSAATAVVPATPQFKAVHAQLVDAWEHRVDAYDALMAAWATDDLSAWDAAAAASRQSKTAEGRYFEAANALLKPYGLWLDAYPGTAESGAQATVGAAREQDADAAP